MRPLLVSAMVFGSLAAFSFSVVHAERAASDFVQFRLGAEEFHGGDAIHIDEILSARSAFESGGRYTVRGRYQLRTRAKATLLLSVTTRGESGPSSRESLRVERGEGSFELSFTLPEKGWPHVTFYSRKSGRPFGGVYFGTGDWLLKKKSWPYDTPPQR